MRDEQMRTEFLESKGYTVIRFKNEEINNDLKTVIVRIKEQLFND
ncbi:MAG: DUF559 domain-containing protein [Prevotella sp.]|nr:DUF559 domain-containing protein [Prevotella sp.]